MAVLRPAPRRRTEERTMFVVRTAANLPPPKRHGRGSGTAAGVERLGNVRSGAPVALLPAALVGDQQRENVSHRPQRDRPPGGDVLLLERILDLVEQCH